VSRRADNRKVEEDRYRAIERELLDAKEELESAFHYAAIGKAIVGLDGSFLRVNRALCELVGYSEEELLAVSFQEITHPADLDDDLDFVRQMIAGEIDTYQMEKRYLGKDGTSIPVLLSVSLVRSPDGEPLRFVSQIQDWRNEIERRELARELEARRRADALSVLAGGLAHDFNNLLVGILGHASLALADVDPSSRARAHLLEVERAARGIAHLTDQMLAYSGKTWLELAPLDPASHVRGVVEAMRPTLPSGVKIHWSLAPDTPSVAADATHLARVTESLLVNAAEAVDGDGTVSVGTGTLYLTRSALDSYSIGREAEPGLFAYIEVADDGAGMDAETQSRMFEPFFTTKFQGRGLGLASVEGLVRSHRGALAVRSEPGGGTRVRLLLPAA
jgi:PAS domain S-box-containing protein